MNNDYMHTPTVAEGETTNASQQRQPNIVGQSKLGSDFDKSLSNAITPTNIARQNTSSEHDEQLKQPDDE